MNYWWTSDYHFSHFNIIHYCKRPFETAEEMNRVIFVNSLRTIITKTYIHYGAKDICMTHWPEDADPDYH